MVTSFQRIPNTSACGRSLEFDFPRLAIGVAEYAEGPTGVTVFHFPHRAVGCVDVRGGAPGTYNVDWLRLGYNFPSLDAVVVSGGSWYGLAAAGGVAAALKQSGARSGQRDNLANVAGAIIYDLGERRPNAIHPDAALGAVALRSARAGRFPQGAHGAGRMAMQGSYFGCWLHSGQGGAFRAVGPTKIACFVVVNAVGVVVDRHGRICSGEQHIPFKERAISELLALVPSRIRSRRGGIVRRRSEPDRHNTTISLVVTNQKLDYAELHRLAVQVHSSMARAIQPFATLNDGDVLFAATTAEVAGDALHPTDLGIVASEVMWDAILSSVPDIDEATASAPLVPVALSAVVGRYQFGEACIDLCLEHARLMLQNTGNDEVFGLPPGAALAANAGDPKTFTTESKYLPKFGFITHGGRPTLVLNPGPWQQTGERD